MTIKYLYENDEERKEIEHIVSVELKRFDDFDIITFDTFENRSCVFVRLENKAYFDDIQNAIDKLGEVGYMTDFHSDVLENLTFVPKVEVL